MTVNVSTRAFVYDHGTLIDITPAGATLASVLSINDAGETVGAYYDGTENHAYLYSNGSSVDLNTLVSGSGNWVLSAAQGINHAGQIVGWGYKNGAQRGFLATPEQ